MGLGETGQQQCPGPGLAVAAQMAWGWMPERKCLERIRWIKATDRIMLPLKKS